MKKILQIISAILYVMTAFFIYKGFNKMFVYENYNDYFIESVNAYVGEDAYNYIINANYTTAYFVLAMGTAIIATMFLIYTFTIKTSEKPQSILIDKKDDNFTSEV